jgi:hypothetical protein
MIKENIMPYTELDLFKEIKASFPALGAEEHEAAAVLLKERVAAAGSSLENYKNYYYPEGMPRAANRAAYLAFLPGDAKIVLDAGRAENLSDFLIAAAPVFRRQLKHKLTERAERAFGVENGAWTPEQEKRFARDFEDFVRTGTATDDAVLSFYKRAPDFVKNLFNGLDRIREPAPKLRAEYEKVFKTNSIEINGKGYCFNQQEYEDRLLQISAGDKTGSHIFLGMTPQMYEKFGFNRIPLMITREHIEKIMHDKDIFNFENYHGLSLDILNQIPEKLKEPLIVLQSRDPPSSIISIVELLDKDRLPIIVPIAQNKSGKFNHFEIDINKVNSIYGIGDERDTLKSYQKWIKQAVIENRLLYVNTKKSRTLPRSDPSSVRLSATSASVTEFILDPVRTETSRSLCVSGFYIDNIERYKQIVKQEALNSQKKLQGTTPSQQAAPAQTPPQQATPHQAAPPQATPAQVTPSHESNHGADANTAPQNTIPNKENTKENIMTYTELDLFKEINASFPALGAEEHEAAALLLRARADALNVTIDQYKIRFHPDGVAVYEKTLPLRYRSYTHFLQDDAKAILNAGKSGDFSGFVRETASIFRHQLTGKLRKWAERALDVKEGEWSGAHKESFATGLETYIRNGAAPSTDLEKVFEIGKDFVQTVYNGLDRIRESAPKLRAEYENVFKTNHIKVYRKNSVFNGAAFERRLTEIFNGDIAGSYEFLGVTPPVYERIGLERMPIMTTRKHLYTSMRKDGIYSERDVNYHDLGIDIVKQIPEKLKNPLLIIQAPVPPDAPPGTPKNSASGIISVIELTDKNSNPVIVPISQNIAITDKKTTIIVNLAKTMYGRGGNFAKWIETARKENRLLYEDIRRSRTPRLPGMAVTSLSGLTPASILVTGNPANARLHVSGFYIDNIERYKQIVKHEALNSQKKSQGTTPPQAAPAQVTPSRESNHGADANTAPQNTIPNKENTMEQDFKSKEKISMDAKDNASRNGWGDEFPSVMHFVDTENKSDKPWKLLSNMPGYGDAKDNENFGTAAKLVENLMETDENQRQLRNLKKTYADAVLVAVHAEEANGKNKLPIALAAYIHTKTGIAIDDSIIQVNKPQRTGNGALHRLAFRPEFDGDVLQGKKYILVDAVFSNGGTLGELRRYIESKGGVVVQAAALAVGNYGDIIAPRPETLKTLLDKHGQENVESFLKEIKLYDGHYEHLTEPEASYLANRVHSLDAARNKIFKARQEGLHRESEERVLQHQPDQVIPGRGHSAAPQEIPPIFSTIKNTSLEENPHGTTPPQASNHGTADNTAPQNTSPNKENTMEQEIESAFLDERYDEPSEEDLRVLFDRLAEIAPDTPQPEPPPREPAQQDRDHDQDRPPQDPPTPAPEPARQEPLQQPQPEPRPPKPATDTPQPESRPPEPVPQDRDRAQDTPPEPPPQDPPTPAPDAPQPEPPPHEPPPQEPQRQPEPPPPPAASDPDVTDMLEYIARSHGAALEYISPEAQTAEIALAAVKQNGLALQWVREDLLNEPLSLAAVSQNAESLRFLKPEAQTESLCLHAVRHNPDALEFVDDSRKSERVCFEALNRDGFALRHIPTELQDNDMFAAAVHKSPFALQLVPEDKRSPSLCASAFSQKPETIEFIPDNYKSADMCDKAVSLRAELLEFVPPDVQKNNPDICKASVSQNGDNLRFVSEQTPAVCLAAVQNKPESLRRVENKTPDICLAAVSKDPNTLACLFPRAFPYRWSIEDNTVENFIDNFKELVKNQGFDGASALKLLNAGMNPEQQKGLVQRLKYPVQKMGGLDVFLERLSTAARTDEIKANFHNRLGSADFYRHPDKETKAAHYEDHLKACEKSGLNPPRFNLCAGASKDDDAAKLGVDGETAIGRGLNPFSDKDIKRLKRAARNGVVFADDSQKEAQLEFMKKHLPEVHKVVMKTLERQEKKERKLIIGDPPPEHGRSGPPKHRTSGYSR